MHLKHSLAMLLATVTLGFGADDVISESDSEKTEPLTSSLSSLSDSSESEEDAFFEDSLDVEIREDHLLSYINQWNDFQQAGGTFEAFVVDRFPKLIMSVLMESWRKMRYEGMTFDLSLSLLTDPLSALVSWSSWVLPSDFSSQITPEKLQYWWKEYCEKEYCSFDHFSSLAGWIADPHLSISSYEPDLQRLDEFTQKVAPDNPAVNQLRDTILDDLLDQYESQLLKGCFEAVRGVFMQRRAIAQHHPHVQDKFNHFLGLQFLPTEKNPGDFSSVQTVDDLPETPKQFVLLLLVDLPVEKFQAWVKDYLPKDLSAKLLLEIFKMSELTKIPEIEARAKFVYDQMDFSLKLFLGMKLEMLVQEKLSRKPQENAWA